jgi:DsbC/DsbD-like thiol-disulfide interchange protein
MFAHLLSACLSVLPAFASVAASKIQPESDKLVALSLTIDHEQVPPGGISTLAVVFKIEQGWHLYWDGLNDTGFPPTIDIELPEGWKALDPLWPAPKRHISENGILDHIYENELVVLVPIVAPQITPKSNASLSFGSRWLVCNEACLPGRSAGSISLPLVALNAPARLNPLHEKLFSKARAALPVPLSKAPAGFMMRATTTELEFGHADATRVSFYPSRDCAMPTHLLVDGTATGQRVILTFNTTPDMIDTTHRFKGIVAVTPKGETNPYHVFVDVPISSAGTVHPAPAPQTKQTGE